MDKVYREEQKQLKKVIELIREKQEYAENSFKEQENFIIGFKEGQRGTQFTRQALMSFYATESVRLARLLKNPYFGRMDFRDLSGKVLPIYIGKSSLTNKEQEMVIYDWRSSICSMYYDFLIGQASYLENHQTISGEILQKRQLIIEEGKLLRVEEQDVNTNDEILMYYLKENADARLKSIVATIQKEQNAIIRNPLKKNYMIQGVAGSGKTTVALHRIAYLLYNDAKTIEESQFMIIGPNSYFLNYISELLPELDIDSVSQNTFEQIALDNIPLKLKLEDQNITLEKVLSKKIDSTMIEYKSSLAYIKLIEDFFMVYINSHFHSPILLDGIEICNLNEIKLSPLDFKNSYRLGYGTIIKQKIQWLSKRIKNRSEVLCHEVWEKYKKEYIKLSETDPRRREIREQVDRLQTEIKKGCPKVLKEYFKFIKVNAISVYVAFLETLTNDVDTMENIEYLDLKEYTLGQLKKKVIGYEDLAPLLWIQHLLTGISSYVDYAHVVIDEAQDLSEAQYYVLKQLFSNSVFDLFGDLNQSIYSYQGISNWESLNQMVFQNEGILLELNKGYRTTYQICDGANVVLSAMNRKLSNCVAREGEEILIQQTKEEELVPTFVKEIYYFLEKGYQTIVILCKDLEETENLYQKLKEVGLDIKRITSQDFTYHGGLCIMPVYLSKGLEFDAVILSNVDASIYSSDSMLDMNLLYVAMTRALHELQIHYANQLSLPLQKINSNTIGHCKKLKKSFRDE